MSSLAKYSPLSGANVDVYGSTDGSTPMIKKTEDVPLEQINPIEGTGAKYGPAWSRSGWNGITTGLSEVICPPTGNLGRDLSTTFNFLVTSHIYKYVSSSVRFVPTLLIVVGVPQAAIYLYSDLLVSFQNKFSFCNVLFSLMGCVFWIAENEASITHSN